MTGLLQRLAGQAMSAQSSGTSRIRSAMSFHAQMPVGLTLDGENARPIPELVPVKPRSRAEDWQTPTPKQPSLPREFTTVIRPVEAAREPQSPVNLARPAESRSMSPLASREPPDWYASRDVVEKAPEPLLEEVEAASSPPLIAPAAQPRLAATVAPGDSRPEPTEVHVHIGRIEVIAAPEAAEPKRNRAAPARNTRPLADYLARRRGS